MRKMLVAEDEAVTRRGIRELVPWETYGIAIAAEVDNGMAALEATRTLRPDVALVDIRMPFMDGLEYCRRVKEEEIAPPVVIISAYDHFRYAQRALRYGVRDYVVKPFDEGELLEAVYRALGYRAGDGTVAEALVPFTGVHAKRDEAFRRIVVRYIAMHFAEAIQLASLSARLEITPTHLAHRIRDEFGVPLTDLVLAYRCEVAKALLRDPALRIYEVAERVGYRDAKTFTAVFKRIAGTTPRAYRQRP